MCTGTLLHYEQTVRDEWPGQGGLRRMWRVFLLLLVIPEVDLINFGASQFGETG